MAVANVTERTVALDKPEARSAMAKMVMKLFALWGIQTADQLELLGLSPNSRAMLTKYRNGTPLPESRDMLDRTGWLLSIHKALALLYPDNPQLRYSWVSLRNQALGNLTPLAVMKEQGLIGIAKVSRYLDFLRGM